ncbi:hypothetical protein GYMLUDRAFT_263238 [Collybiopsis luxurians FD-317 M1]|uniref:Unplaced genomic scaffold GYMLUscaffold_44, whole genome shotgun sequence n=1 Tax=Collybiopsis luxurians FD-317 M1 TaxID=944289 RepID=A0A0D0C416_9AGAR|nr:hypothetical protein GYMLUDRAFT_263238 [Collybiopsis luxurians FD-317 M1]
MNHPLNMLGLNTQFPNSIPVSIPQTPPFPSQEILAGTPITPSVRKSVEEAACTMSTFPTSTVPGNAIETAKDEAVALRAITGIQAISAPNPGLIDGVMTLASNVADLTNVVANLNDNVGILTNTIVGLTVGVHNLLARVEVMDARVYNLKHGNINNMVKLTGSRTSRYLQKEVPGDGTWRLIAAGLPAANLPWVWPVAAAVGQPNHLIGTLPTFLLVPDVITYNFTAAQISSFVIFYNHDFGIVPGDPIAEKQFKFREFLSGRL